MKLRVRRKKLVAGVGTTDCAEEKCIRDKGEPQFLVDRLFSKEADRQPNYL
jgi:hypothetical protein